MTTWQQFLSTADGPAQVPGPDDTDPRERDALDAYSRVVVQVAEQVAEASFDPTTRLKALVVAGALAEAPLGDDRRALALLRKVDPAHPMVAQAQALLDEIQRAEALGGAHANVRTP